MNADPENFFYHLRELNKSLACLSDDGFYVVEKDQKDETFKAVKFVELLLLRQRKPA